MTPFRVIIVGACIPLAAPADYAHIQVPAHRAPAFIARRGTFHFEHPAARRYPDRGVGRKALRTCERLRGYPSTHPDYEPVLSITIKAFCTGSIDQEGRS